MVDRPHVGTAYRIGEIRVDLRLIAGRHLKADRGFRSPARAGPWRRR
jgi:hypothetical protein